MPGRFALFAFNSDPMCFLHVIINALELREKGNEVKVIIEGSATKLVKDFENKENSFYKFFQKLKESTLIDCFCKTCSNKMGVLEDVEKQKYRTCAELMGHPSMTKYIELGYTILTF